MDTKNSEAMATALARPWWVFLVRGVAAVAFGILTLIWPHITLLTLVVLFGAFALVDGVSSFARAFSAGQRGQSWVWPVIGGVVSVAAGVAALVWPVHTAVILLYIIAAWALVSGILEIITGVALRHEISDEWLLIVGGVISVVFGLIVFARPGVGALAIVWLIGFYAIVIGVAHIALAFRLRNWRERWVPGGRAGMPPAAA